MLQKTLGPAPPEFFSNALGLFAVEPALINGQIKVQCS